MSASIHCSHCSLSLNVGQQDKIKGTLCIGLKKCPLQRVKNGEEDDMQVVVDTNGQIYHIDLDRAYVNEMPLNPKSAARHNNRITSIQNLIF